nr:unnamed protein product [Callosobruchus chinensis]
MIIHNFSDRVHRTNELLLPKYFQEEHIQHFGRGTS